MERHVKNQLIERLSETHAAIQEVIEGVDLERCVHADTGWRIKDILWHIATWVREVAKALRAFRAGGEYVIPDIGEDETEFNLQAAERMREWSDEQILAEWEQAREDFKAALEDIPADRFPGDLVFPWGGERGSIAHMVEYMIEHDEEHMGEIVRALQTPEAE